MIKIKIKNKLRESAAGTNENNFGVYAADNDVINYILVDLNALASLIERSGKEPPIPSKLLTKDALFNAGVVAGGLELDRASGQLSGPCLDAFNVNGSVMHRKFAGQGLGKWLYRLAMSHVGEPIIPDRSSVSPSAQRVWASLERDSSIQKDFPVEYYGNSDTPKKYTLSKLDTSGEETPPPHDDCEGTKTKNAPAFLNRAYKTTALKSESNTLINKLKQFVAANIAEPSLFYSNLVAANNKLFATRLGSG